MQGITKYALVIVTILGLIIPSLACIKIVRNEQTPTPNQGQTSNTGPTRPHPPVRTGEISVGQKIDIASQSVGTSGGIIAVSKPGDPLDGFVINVPPKSYPDSRTFKVSSAPITNQTFGKDISPVSPMIYVDNGGSYADEVMYIRVPVKVPEGNFAMGFLYEDKNKQLEGMPLVGKDAESVTVATRHFSNFFISMISKELLKKDIDSGFRPGIDDWQFTNYGSFIAPGGHCEGQSLAAMWYYCTQPDGKDLCLYGRYDNNGNKPETPSLWEDDSLGYRFCSVIQEEKRFDNSFWDNLGGKNWELKNNKWELKNVPGIGDEATFYLFTYSILATGEPQEVGIWSKAGGGHAMIVNKVVGNALYIADPNYPGNTDRKIIYYSGDGKFKPYNSGTNKKEIDAGNGKAYEAIIYSGKSTVVPWDSIAKHWAEFKNGTIGNDKFPQYVLSAVDDSGKSVPLTDGFTTGKKMFNVNVNFDPALIRYYRDGAELKLLIGGIELKPGNNLLGIYITKMAASSRNFEYVDFKYFNVKYGDDECKTPPPADMMAKLQKTTIFRCELVNLPTTIDGKGSMQKWVPGFKFTKHFYVPGNAIKLGGEGTMPITWSGTSFSGGGTKEYPDKLTGSVCYSGGKMMVSFDYVTNDPADNLTMSVKNLPCDPERLMKPASGGRPELVYMNTDAPVVKGFVTTLEWKSHEERRQFSGPPEVWDALLTAKDWSAKCGFYVTIH